MIIRRCIILLILVVFLGMSVIADQQPAHDQSINDVLAEIRRELGLEPNDPINPDMVPPDLLEELGEAVMSVMHPNPVQHEWMDQMMGGEGSASLAAAHRWMGYRNLAGGYGPGRMQGSGMMGMMGQGMMGNSQVPYGQIPHDSPEEILKRRYANGEITREEYLQILEDIKH